MILGLAFSFFFSFFAVDQDFRVGRQLVQSLAMTMIQLPTKTSTITLTWCNAKVLVDEQ